MKNKDRITKLEVQVQMLKNLVEILQMKIEPLECPEPPEWAGMKPFWVEGPKVTDQIPTPFTPATQWVPGVYIRVTH